ncbi:hypothetical protein [Virgibacillus senegalensis]|uniref:hypothetical protein n=1 Tax=Virgibacillus senegalensis TaxID=1499679 RepID=UPI00069F94FD|nr:hypothetical protein [Virgibacillus senegalensis]
MELDFFWLAVGIAVAGYFIGEGLKNFKNPETKGLIDAISDDDDQQLLKESDIPYFLGITKKDAESLKQDFPDIPHIIINSKVYYPKAKLREWLKNIGS